MGKMFKATQHGWWLSTGLFFFHRSIRKLILCMLSLIKEYESSKFHLFVSKPFKRTHVIPKMLHRGERERGRKRRREGGREERGRERGRKREKDRERRRGRKGGEREGSWGGGGD